MPFAVSLSTTARCHCQCQTRPKTAAAWQQNGLGAVSLHNNTSCMQVGRLAAYNMVVFTAVEAFKKRAAEALGV